MDPVERVLASVNGTYSSAGDVVREFLQKNVSLDAEQCDRILAAYLLTKPMQSEFRQYNLTPLVYSYNQLKGNNLNHAMKFYEKYTDLVNQSRLKADFLQQYNLSELNSSQSSTVISAMENVHHIPQSSSNIEEKQSDTSGVKVTQSGTTYTSNPASFEHDATGTETDTDTDPLIVNPNSNILSNNAAWTNNVFHKDDTFDIEVGPECGVVVKCHTSYLNSEKGGALVGLVSQLESTYREFVNRSRIEEMNRRTALGVAFITGAVFVLVTFITAYYSKK
mmetsp:Transcript_7863/g.8337  ORF Transcript_7863/g.8337 Transcript_7863/m.8337 type:complete len:279 (-) Transcript_7863:110-946(-)|eukprot:CAMPEP_0174820536 /NCGR_PEP_ID=MMETSP1107-20130205/4442_1 /TAXON_ID=36770 /ORGANISM="Paraphysomonas vestita, Strain GFlagA" /LENGTH=278 /DNA_ID=CAMNT_0016036087 /DNA_START=51 /DNA_END=887 /DNA_ORIENTATION=-